MVAGSDRDIQVATPCVDPLEGEALFRLEAVVVQLLERALDPVFVLVVLVRWVGRPVARRGQHLDQQQAGRRIVLGEDPVDAPLGHPLAAHLDRDITRANQARPAVRVGGRGDDRQLERRPGAQPIRGTRWQQ